MAKENNGSFKISLGDPISASGGEPEHQLPSTLYGILFLIDFQSTQLHKSNGYSILIGIV